jgi:hypothetical protein
MIRARSQTEVPMCIARMLLGDLAQREVKCGGDNAKCQDERDH